MGESQTDCLGRDTGLTVHTVEILSLRDNSCRDSPLSDTKCSTMNLTILASLSLLALVSTAPQSRNFRGGNNRFGNNNQNSPNTRFFTGNRPLDDAIVGASLGLATQYIANNIFNPCRNRNTNNRIFNSNGVLGFIGGFAAGQAINNIQGNPCG